MKLFDIPNPAKLAGAATAAIVLLSVSASTLSAFDDKEKEKKAAPAHARQAPERSREAPAPAHTRQAPEAAPSRSAPAPSYTPPARQERNPNVASPSRQESSPSYNSPARQTQAPSYNPQGQQERNPSYNPPSRQTPSPSYNPSPAGRSQNGSRMPAAQPNANTPASSGGFRRIDAGGPANVPAHGNIQNQPGPASLHNYSGQSGAASNQKSGGVKLPPGQTTRNTDGSAIHRTTDGGVIHMDPRGRVTNVEVRGGGQVHYAPNGAPDRVVTRSGAVIMNRPGGVRQIVVERPGHVVMVTNPHGQGYIQRPFVVSGHEYYQRTYYVQGRPYVNVYRPYHYGGISFQVYAPMRYYRPAFYGWAYSPWNRPVYYSWGWGASPWYGYYGPYFAPYPVYRSPIFWLTDFLFSATLEYGYEQRMSDAYAAGVRDASYQSQQAMSPDVKQMVADEVQRQLAQERAEGQNAGNVMQDPGDSLPGIFNDGASHALVVYNPIQANDGGMGCALTEGDVVGFEGNLTPGVEYASVRVLASKGQDCATGGVVGVSLQDILDMQNHLRETIDRGLGQLQTNAGRGGLPALPPQAMGAPIATPIASAVPPPDPNGAAELNRQAQEATQGEQTVLSEAPPLDTAAAGPAAPTVSLGMTADQVQSLLGPPRRIVDLGQKKMLIYDDMKVIFMDGRVSDVQ